MTTELATTVTSRDGTPIGYWTSGAGPPLVLVHGSTADHTRWRTVLPYLEPNATVHAVDRRGRGASGDARDYALEREFEDVATVVDAAAEAARAPVDLLGHSFGALCCLGGAALATGLRRLVLYEPAGTSVDDPIPPELIGRLEALLAEDRREEVLVTFFREAVQIPEPQLDVLRSLPAWQGRVAAAHTIARELRAIESHRYDPADIAAVTVPTLVLAGGESPAGVRGICDAVAGALPHGRLAVLEGQQHVAMDTAPELFGRLVAEFLAQEG
ncbi:alpha/beta fold hydrolase [Allosalinactinospora lopnorensis]|uniref:alpha/beta fold hydrolase n=1 Tax=Allosalinactinospora lopnorensis TaxID=1352348 RepID=UPI000623EBBE|nr:alpha/beta hydrolase [Allosalinactinospora lopnorensis]